MDKKGVEASSEGTKEGSQGREQKRVVTLESEFIPPDGGYGWVIVIACGMANFCMLPLIQNFGLIYKDIMKEWKMTTAEYSFIVNFQFSMSNFVGLITGPMLRMYGYRRVSIWGSILVGISAVLTSQVKTFSLFVVTFSMIGGVGVGFGWSATALAINTYFKEKRGIATGFSWTATGLSPVVIPFLVTWLLANYDVHNAVLILSGVMLHNIPASLLLHPVEWHTKPFKIELTAAEDSNVCEETKVLMGEDKEKEGVDPEGGTKSPNLRNRRIRQDSGDFLVDTQGTIGLEVAAPVSRHSSKWSLVSIGEVSRRTSFSLDRITVDHKGREGAGVLVEEEEETEDPPPESLEKRSFMKRTLSRVVDFFDLGLLSEPRFLMIFLGLTLAFGGEMNFTLLTPFVLADHGLSMDKVALFMSILASVDLVTRFSVPFLTDAFKLDSRLMYSIGITILATGRIMLAHLSGFYTVLLITLWCGLGKGLRTVYMALILPATVPLERLPAASGLNMTANGIMFILIGPLFGYIRDNSGSFVLPLHAINFMSFSAILVWIIEVIYTRNRRRRDKLKEEKKLAHNSS